MEERAREEEERESEGGKEDHLASGQDLVLAREHCKKGRDECRETEGKEKGRGAGRRRREGGEELLGA